VTKVELLPGKLTDGDRVDGARVGDSNGCMLGSVFGAVVGRDKFIGAFVDQSRGAEVGVSLALPSADGALDDTKVGSSVLANVLGAMLGSPT
jgi:hypothetical protein